MILLLEDVYINYLELCTGNLLFSPIYSIIYLYQHRLIYFILWIIMEYYFTLLLKPFQIWTLEALSVGSCVP